MTAALGPFIMRHPEVKGNMEHFMIQNVLPEFTATEPYMRAVVSTQRCMAFVSKADMFLTGERGLGHRHQGWLQVLERAGKVTSLLHHRIRAN